MIYKPSQEALILHRSLVDRLTNMQGELIDQEIKDRFEDLRIDLIPDKRTPKQYNKTEVDDSLFNFDD